MHDLNWNKKFQQLKEYQEKYGDCQPNPNEFSELNTWVQVSYYEISPCKMSIDSSYQKEIDLYIIPHVQVQRRMHTLRMEGQSSSLTDDVSFKERNCDKFVIFSLSSFSSDWRNWSL